MRLHIAVLTGRRPDLLDRTLSSFVAHHHRLWDAATRTVFHNTGDPDTARVLDVYRWDDRQTYTDGMLSIGDASQLLGRQVADGGCDVVLRLEDDWEATDVDWWEGAVRLLEHVAQVRLRDASERVMSNCMVCRTRLQWKPLGDHLVSADGHYTHNPSLMRVLDFLDLFPYRNERHAASNFHGRPVGQHRPGGFRHLGGEGRSLKKQGGRT